jgi:hypothetical protein
MMRTQVFGLLPYGDPTNENTQTQVRRTWSTLGRDRSRSVYDAVRYENPQSLARFPDVGSVYRTSVTPDPAEFGSRAVVAERRPIIRCER